MKKTMNTLDKIRDNANKTFERAKAGDVEAQFETGNIFSSKIIILLEEDAENIYNYEQAKFWYTQAAQKGHLRAKTALRSLMAKHKDIQNQITISVIQNIQAMTEDTSPRYQSQQINKTASEKYGVEDSLQKLSLADNKSIKSNSSFLNSNTQVLKKLNSANQSIPTKAELKRSKAEKEAQSYKLIQRQSAINTRIEELSQSVSKLDAIINTPPPQPRAVHFYEIP